ncbi:MAG: universal stress protein [Dehalococcoidia bacterium]|jgi:nucleotide-binding universal stress UspA family protein|nr:universal stress protein [Dehalococcoidia bacterium]
MKYRKMLVPLDTTRFAECVLDHVKEISTTRAIPEVVLYSVVEPIPAATIVYLGDAGVQESEKRARSAMLDYLGRVKKELALSSSNVSTVVEMGRPAEKILDFIAKQDVDIVVMAKHSRGDQASKLYLGNVTEKVLRGSTAPVFLVPVPGCGA